MTRNALQSRARRDFIRRLQRVSAFSVTHKIHGYLCISHGLRITASGICAYNNGYGRAIEAERGISQVQSSVYFTLFWRNAHMCIDLVWYATKALFASANRWACSDKFSLASSDRDRNHTWMLMALDISAINFYKFRQNSFQYLYSNCTFF